MRAVALLLILANLGFLGWSQLVDTRSPRAELAAKVGASSAPRLVLSTEAKGTAARSTSPAIDPALVAGTQGDASLPPAELTSAANPVVGAPGELQCVSVGAFRDLAEAVQASAALQTAGYASRQRVDQGDVWLGYWVSVQNLASREAAEKVLADLAQRGISDAYILPGSEPANTLSLGVFNDAARAQRRVEEIKALGYDAQLADRKRAGSVYWLDVDLPAPGALFDAAVLQTQPGKIVRLEFRACPEGSEQGAEAAVPEAPAAP
ncbi:MAG: SPOR domain-containing protein [Steroidobacteraceae bacterium]